MLVLARPGSGKTHTFWRTSFTTYPSSNATAARSVRPKIRFTHGAAVFPVRTRPDGVHNAASEMVSVEERSGPVSSVGKEIEARPIAALIFDMDGLLVDSEPASESALLRFLEGHGHALRPGTVDAALGRRLPEAIAAVAETYALAGQLDELVAAFAAIRLQSLRGSIVAMSGAVEMLDWADDRGFPTALATSSSRDQADVALAETNLSGRVTVEATGDEVAHGKPEPDLFLLAAKRLRVEPQSCLVFEDAPAGLEAAARAHMHRIWVPNAHTRHLTPIVSVDAVLDSLRDAPPWLEAHGVGGRHASPAPGTAGAIIDESPDAARVKSV